MKKYLKNLLLKQTFDSKNVITLLEQLEECSNVNIDCAISIVTEGLPKRNINTEKCKTETTEYYKKYYPEITLTFTKITINELEDRVRVFFNKSDSKYEDYYDLYNIDKYCND